MKFFRFWDKDEFNIDLSKRKIDRLKRLTKGLEIILLENGFGFYSDYLNQIWIAANAKNGVEFRTLVESQEIFGGSGALWEIYIENRTDYKRFNKQFCRYIDHIKRMGIANNRIQQIRETMLNLR